MIQKLRMKFIWISMGSLVAVIALLMGVIHLLNYKSMIVQADTVLELLADNNGVFPKPDNPGDFFKQRRMSPETPYENRFFVVELSEEGNTVWVDTGKIAAVDTQVALLYATDAWEKGKSRGFLYQYRYRKEKTDDGWMLVFLDCGRSMDSCRSFLLISAGVSAAGVLLVFILIFILSGKIMKPVYESYEKQKRFITDAGHEIKTPLTVIAADIDVLGMDIGENEWLDDMKKQIGRLKDLTNDLIYLARMEEGNVCTQQVDLPFSDLVEETAQSFQALAIVQKKTLTVDVQPMLMLHGNEGALRRLVAVLLDNAVKYSDDNGVISLKLEKRGRFYRLSVYNTSKLVEKEMVEHMFERFYRADPSRNSGKKGYGIGLSIAKAIVLAHKGEIYAQTKDACSLKIVAVFPIK